MIHHIGKNLAAVGFDERMADRCRTAARELGVYEFVETYVCRACGPLTAYFWYGRRFGGLPAVRRALAHELRMRGLAWKAIGEVLGLTANRAQKGAALHVRSKKENEQRAAA